MSEFTDPATELEQLFRHLKNYEMRGSTRDALAAIFGCKADDDVYYLLLSVITSRCVRFKELVSNDPELDGHKGNIISAITVMSSIFSTQLLHAAWNDRKNACLPEHHLISVGMANISLKKTHVLIKLSDQERKKLSDDISSILHDVTFQNSIHAQMVLTSLNGIKLFIEKLEFFGADCLIDKLCAAAFEIQAAILDRPANCQCSNLTVPEFAKKALVVIAATVQLLIVSDAASTALENHYNRGQKLLNFLKSELHEFSEHKLLEPPTIDILPEQIDT
ncbi:MAG: hypothetical protein HQL44_06180 [Alphaproteobacteria bacterium]|nr:hypothetical protein [Alphaproteobacteria bacterium]